MWMVYQVTNGRTEEAKYYITKGAARELIQVVLEVEDAETNSMQRIEWERPLGEIADLLCGAVEVWGDLPKIARELGQD